jgi:protein SCO1/2
MTATATTPATSASGYMAPAEPSEPFPAPAFTLRDQRGKAVSLADFRGKAVMLTFVFAQCPDVCPLIMQALERARRKLGPSAGDMAIVAVSVDPKGDTPKRVRQFLADRKLTGKAEYLLGTRARLEPVWRSYNIVQKDAEPGQPETLAHSALIYGIDAKGIVRTLYPASPLEPDVLAHDARLLVKEA